MQKGLLVNSCRYFVTQIYNYSILPHHDAILTHLEEHQRTIDLDPRGSGKTRIGDIGYATWRAAVDPNIRILIVSDTDTHAVRFLGTIKTALRYSQKIKQYFGEQVGEKWTDHEIVLKGRTKILTEATITALGMYSGAVTSGHYDIIIADDLVNLENSRTEGSRERARVWFKETLLPTLIPGGEIHVLGTRYHYLDMYQMVIDELKYDALVQPAITVDEDGTEHSIWEEYMPLDDRTTAAGEITQGLRSLREDLGSVIFSLQYQNDVELMKEGNIFHFDWFRYYEVQEIDGEDWAVCDDGVKVRIKDMPKFGGVDPAVSEKTSADYFALCINGVDQKSKRNFVLDMVQGRFTYLQRGRLIMDKWEQWSPRVIGIEDNASQLEFVQRIKQTYPKIRIKRKTTVHDKTSRAYNRAGLVENGKVFVRRSHHKFVEQCTTMPDGDHDDMFDAWDMALYVSNTAGGMLSQSQSRFGAKTYGR